MKKIIAIAITLTTTSAFAGSLAFDNLAQNHQKSVKVTCYSGSIMIYNKLVYNVAYPTAASPSAPSYKIYMSKEELDNDSPSANIAGGACVSERI